MTARNAFADLATENTLAQVRDALGPAATQATAQAVLDLLTAVQNPSRQALTVSGTRDKFRDGFTTGTVAQPVDPAVWTLVNEAPDTGDGRGHLVLPGGDSQGAAYLRVSLSPFTAGTAVHLVSRDKFTLPIRHAWGASMSQRVTGQEVIFGLAEGLDSDAVLGLNRLPQPADLPIVGTVTTNGTVQTMTVTNHGLKGNDRVIVVGNAEKRLDVGPVYVTVIDANTITVPNILGAGTFTAGGVVRAADPVGLLNNAAIQLWGDNGTTTNATYAARRNGTKPRTNANQGANTSFPTQINTSPYSDAWLAGGPSEIWANIDEVVWRSWTDGNGGNSGYLKFQQSIPDETLSYRLYCRAKNLDNYSRPVARIVSIAKTGTTTATVTTDVPHGLAVADQVGITGVRDQTNFPQTGSSVVAVPTATTFTVVDGSAVTATDTFGGTVWVYRGNISAPGNLSVAVQTVTKTGAVLTVTCNVAPTAVPGDYLNLHGTLTSGAGNNFDGAYKVLRVTGNTLELAYTGTQPDQVTYNTGGTMIKRTDVRLHFARILGHTRLMTEVIGGRGSTVDANNSVPVSISQAASLTINAPSILTTVGEYAPLSTTSLLASGVYTQTAIDSGVNATSRYAAIRVLVSHVAGNTHGHLTLEQSTDNATFRETARIPVPSDGATGGLHTFDFPLMQRYWRVKFTNGATAQTGFYLAAETLRAEPSRDLAKVLMFPLTPVAGQAAAASSATWSATLDLGVNHSWSVARLLAFSDTASAAGGIAVQQSMDGSTWFSTSSAANTAGAAGLAEERITCRYVRAYYTNGAAAATALRLNLSLVSL